MSTQTSPSFYIIDLLSCHRPIIVNTAEPDGSHQAIAHQVTDKHEATEEEVI